MILSIRLSFERSLTSSKTSKITSVLKGWKSAPATCFFSSTCRVFLLPRSMPLGRLLSWWKGLSHSLLESLLSPWRPGTSWWKQTDLLCAATARDFTRISLLCLLMHSFILHIVYKFSDVWWFILLWVFSVYQKFLFMVTYNNYFFE